MEQLINIAINLILLPIAFVAGRFTEGRHFRRLAQRERELAYINRCNLRWVADPDSVVRADLVIGHVVIATDYWKSFVTKLRKLVGGEMKAAQSLLVRGRREALVRLLETARLQGATEVWNVRYGFCNISQMRGNNGAMQVEIFAYGTAISRRLADAATPSPPGRGPG